MVRGRTCCESSPREGRSITNQLSADVVVIGAGVAGLAAARDLCAAHLDVLIVEARNRIGGRIHTLHDPLWPVPIELGAEFVHGRPPELWDLFDSNHLAVYDVTGDHRCFQDASLGPCEDSFGALDTMLDGAPKMGPDLTFAELLSRSEASTVQKRWASLYVEGFNAADKNRISVRSLQRQQEAEEQIDGDSSFRVVAGYDSISLALFSRIDTRRLHLNSVAKAIDWEPNRASIYLETPAHDDLGQITARKVIITVPISVLLETPAYPAGLRFKPQPADVLEATRMLELGHAARITFLFRYRFWESRPDLASLSFLHSLEPWFPTWWSRLPMRVPVLTAWAGGPTAEQCNGCGEGVWIDRALDSLSHILDWDRSQLRAQLLTACSHDWSSDPYARGAYTYIPRGAVDAPRMLSEPVQETLFFAGEATDYSGHYGTVHGAIATGRRAAAQVLDSLRI